MRVMIVSCVFPPEPVVSARTSADLAGALSARGHDVRVVAPFPNRPAGRIFPGFRRRWRRRVREQAGYDLVRRFACLSPRSTLFSRLLENVSFGLAGAWEALTAARPDVIYANTWPLLATGLLAAAARWRGIPLVVTVQDVYPESLMSQRRVNAGGLALRALCRLDGWIARQSRMVWVVSRRFEAVYASERGVSADRLHYVPNWLDERSVTVDPEQSSVWRRARGIPSDAFLCVYGGNVGAAAGVETLVEAMEQVRGRASCYALIAGAGSRLAACRRRAEAAGNPRILFHSPWPAEETGLVLGAADLLILPTRGSQARVSVPSKLLAYFLSGRPVVAAAAADTELAALVSAGGGWVVAPDDPAALAAAVERARAESKSCLTERGARGRLVALTQFARAAVLPRAVALLEQAGSG